MVTIYAIRCMNNGMAYIGCTSAKLSKRMREHRCLLNKGKHSSSVMALDWQQFGQSAFVLETLEVLSSNATVDEKRRAELRWMRKYSSEGRLYNANMQSFAPQPDAIKMGIEASRHVAGNRWTPEANEKRRLAQLGKPKGHGAKISATKRRKKLEHVMS